MENIKDDVWREWHKKWEADSAKHLGKEKATFNEKRIAYFAWREAIEMCNAEIEASNSELTRFAEGESGGAKRNES